uniref:Uncharacterized protein LOC111109499 isoform X1 n=1 Tax=Crassostrea virginica TaxID=6565 RepID=A0A8B8BD73_CRAVI|nr:uncharacterized protein LOC111109499 isoform X1 [Crassostrea virginica]
MIMNIKPHVISIILCMCSRFGLGLLTCDVEGACGIVREITNCKLTKDPIYSTKDIKDIYSAGTKVADPRCQRIEITLSKTDKANIVIKWNAPRSSHIRGFSIQIGHDQTGLRFTEYYMDLRDLAGKRCLIGQLQSLNFELHCNYTGSSTRLDVILTSLPRLYNDPVSMDNLMSVIIPPQHARDLPETIHLNKSCGSDENDALYRTEVENECQTMTPALRTTDHLPYTLAVISLAFVIAFFIVSFLVARNKTVCQRSSDDNESHHEIKHCTTTFPDEGSDTHSQTAVQTNGVGLFGSGSTGVGMFGSGSTVPDSDLQQAPTPRDSQHSLSLSQVSIATQDIENAMLEINFGNPLNNLNK